MKKGLRISSVSILALSVALAAFFATSADAQKGKKAPAKPARAQANKKSARAATGGKSARAGSGAKGSARAGARSRNASRAGKKGGDTAAEALASRGGKDAGGSGADKSCRASYASCMDLQIKPYVAKYDYLAKDEATKQIQNSSDPLRCIYYDESYAKKLYSTTNLKQYCKPPTATTTATGWAQVTVPTTPTAAGAKTTVELPNFCSGQRQLNELYLTYNYYCKLGSMSVDSRGTPVQRCEKLTAASNSFATKQSYAYYKEATRRVDDGELKIINFEQTSLYKDKIRGILTDCEIDGQASKTAQAYNEKCAEDAVKNWQKFSLMGTDSAGNLKYVDPVAKKNVIAKLTITGANGTTQTAAGDAATKTISESTTYVYEDGSGDVPAANVAKLQVIQVTDDLVTDLGLDTGDGARIFSINVAPPATAGSLEPSGLFQKASDLCFSGIKTLPDSDKKFLGTKVADEVQQYITNLRKCGDSIASRDDLERYYMTGAWADPCEEGYSYNETSNKCVNKENRLDVKNPLTMADLDTNGGEEADPDAPAPAPTAPPELKLADSHFLSAKRSCDVYENALIATRNKAYGDFDTALSNYIEDNVAKIIQRKNKDQATVANSFMSVVQTNTDIAIAKQKMNMEAYKMKNQALMEIMQADIDIDNKRNEMTLAQMEASRARASAMAGKYSAAMTPMCSTKVRSVFTSVCGADWNNCGAEDSRQFMIKNRNAIQEIAAGVANQSVYVNKDGDVQAKEEEAVTVAGQADLQSITGALEGYERIYCVDLPNYENAIINPMKADLTMIYDYIFKMNCGGAFEPCTGGEGCTNGMKVRADMQNLALSFTKINMVENYDFTYNQTIMTNADSSSECGKDCSTHQTKTDIQTVEQKHLGVLTYTWDKTYVKDDGKCYDHYWAKDSVTVDLESGDRGTGKKDTMTRAGEKEIVNPDLGSEYIGRGAKVFEDLIRPALNLAAKPASAK
ncbi:MAG: hypothetical protein LBL52_01170 [Rickettsiales bacterium]|jgi:hypothetical protein|nr:hypothetical protein [Rickettsiales bacterium]